MDESKHITFEDIERANAGLKTLTITRWDSKRNCNVSKDYIEVNQKIKAFRRLYPEGTISTEILQLEGGYCAIKATVMNEAGAILATGHASEREDTNQINKTNLIENCETSAIGRALLMCGCGIESTFEDPGTNTQAAAAAPAAVNQEPKKPATKKAAPKTKAAEENTAAAFNNLMCEECGAPIVDNAKATAQQIAARSKKQFNKCLCWGCAIAKTKAAAALKAAQEEAKRKAAEAEAAAAGEDEEPVTLPFPV